MKNPHNERQRLVRIARAARFQKMRDDGLTLQQIANKQRPKTTRAAIWNVLNKDARK